MDASGLRAQQIDPRDVQTEYEISVYRVYFVDGDGATDEYRVEGAVDVRQVLAWADEHAAGRGFDLYVETEGRTGKRLDLLAKHQ
ncbi:hypothetical protein SAMN02800687_3405 [Curtobacterium sp. UNCCL20]|uniref:hypothetical protein n=1 Tax=Curtobacterium sp. UNCCL20 TaxID=1502773 RepID=UPI00088F56E0|nr:hypothetical protein [Curtobacterium sp. UNCCL20]SDR03529.1 hypothetical protein SAMN02800687_3405 [Curtobacterium sp. UNCCL20]